MSEGENIELPPEDLPEDEIEARDTFEAQETVILHNLLLIDSVA